MAAGAARAACGSPRLQSGNFPAGPEVPPLPAGAADLRRLPPKRPRSAPGGFPAPPLFSAGAGAPPALGAAQTRVSSGRDTHEAQAAAARSPVWAQSCRWWAVLSPLCPRRRCRSPRAEVSNSWGAGSCGVFARCPAPGEVPGGSGGATNSWKGGCFAEVFPYSSGGLMLGVCALSVGLLGSWRRDVTRCVGKGKSTSLLSPSKLHSVF